MVQLLPTSGTSVGRDAVLDHSHQGGFNNISASMDCCCCCCCDMKAFYTLKYYSALSKNLNNFTMCPSAKLHFFLASPLNVTGMYQYWPERPSQQFSSRAWRSSSVRNSYHPPPFTEERPSELESRLEVLHSQLNRCTQYIYFTFILSVHLVAIQVLH